MAKECDNKKQSDFNQSAGFFGLDVQLSLCGRRIVFVVRMVMEKVEEY